MVPVRVDPKEPEPEPEPEPKPKFGSVFGSHFSEKSVLGSTGSGSGSNRFQNHAHPSLPIQYFRH